MLAHTAADMVDAGATAGQTDAQSIFCFPFSSAALLIVRVRTYGLASELFLVALRSSHQGNNNTLGITTRVESRRTTTRD